jgi:TM2 domain-containing membrane protein YozV
MLTFYLIITGIEIFILLMLFSAIKFEVKRDHYMVHKNSNIPLLILYFLFFIAPIINIIAIIVALKIIFNFDEYVENTINDLLNKGLIVKKGELND